MMFGQWRIATDKLGLNDIKTDLGFEGWVSRGGDNIPQLTLDINQAYQWIAMNNGHYNSSGYYYYVREHTI